MKDEQTGKYGPMEDRGVYVSPSLAVYGRLTALTGSGSGIDQETKGQGGQVPTKRP